MCADHDGCGRKIREVQAGIEEEGVPYTRRPGESSDAVSLAWQGANASGLGTGLGISPDGVCIHYHKLAANAPLFIAADTGYPELWRQFGYNAARLVKGLPFKTSRERSWVIECTPEQLVAHIQELVEKILQENGRVHREVSRW